MCLLELHVGDTAQIDAIDINENLKRRFSSLGLVNCSQINIMQFGLFKSTVQICVNRTLIALRKNEAKLIQVHQVVA
jgi:Fe2+ transport system protein FeoA